MNIPMVYPPAVCGSVSVLVATVYSTVVPGPGFGEKNGLGICSATLVLAVRLHPLGSVMVSVPRVALIAPVACVQPTAPTSVTTASAGVVGASTITSVGSVDTDSITVPPPVTVVCGVIRMVTLGASPVSRLLSVRLAWLICCPTAEERSLAKSLYSKEHKFDQDT